MEIDDFEIKKRRVRFMDFCGTNFYFISDESFLCDFMDLYSKISDTSFMFHSS